MIIEMKKVFHCLALAGLCTSVFSLSGCSYLQIGEEEFACSGMPDSVFCHSSREVYERTNDGVVPSPVGEEGVYNEDCPDCVKSHLDGGKGAAANKTEYGSALFGSTAEEKNSATEKNEQSGAINRSAPDEIIDAYVTPALPERPIPIRTPSQVMRIWIAPYIDVNGDYNAPGYVYTEIEPRRWVLAKEYENAARVFEPLKTEKPIEVIEENEGFNSLEKLKDKSQAKAQK